MTETRRGSDQSRKFSTNAKIATACRRTGIQYHSVRKRNNRSDLNRNEYIQTVSTFQGRVALDRHQYTSDHTTHTTHTRCPRKGGKLERTKIGEVEAGVGPAECRSSSVGNPGLASLSGEPFRKRGDGAQGAGGGGGVSTSRLESGICVDLPLRIV